MQGEIQGEGCSSARRCCAAVAWLGPWRGTRGWVHTPLCIPPTPCVAPMPGWASSPHTAAHSTWERPWPLALLLLDIKKVSLITLLTYFSDRDFVGGGKGVNIISLHQLPSLQSYNFSELCGNASIAIWYLPCHRFYVLLTSVAFLKQPTTVLFKFQVRERMGIDSSSVWEDASAQAKVG